MQDTPRHTLILEHLDRVDHCTINGLSKMFSVSHMSIRRDLKRLQEKGLVKVSYGGQVKRNFLSGTPIYDFKQHRFSESKKIIGELALSLLQPGMVVFLDGGTTTWELALMIDMPLTVITPDLSIAIELSQKPAITTLICPGEILGNSRASYNSETMKYLSGHVTDIAFIGADGFSLEDGALTTSQIKADCKWMAIERAIQCALLVDSSKFNLRCRHKVADLDRFHFLVTDQTLPKPIYSYLLDKEIKLISR